MISASREPQRSASATSPPACCTLLLGRAVLFAFLLRHLLAVGVDHPAGLAHQALTAVLHPEHAVADALHQVQRVAHQQERLALGQELLDAPQAAVGESLVAHGEHLVDQQDVGVGVDGHGEAQAHVHAGGVVLDRLLHEVAEAGELHDLVVLALDLLAGQAEHGAVDEDVLPARDLGVEAGAQLDQGGHAAGDRDAAGGGLEHAGDQLEQGGFARAVAADDAERLAPADGEVDVLQGGDGLLGLQIPGSCCAPTRALLSVRRRSPGRVRR